MLLRGADRETTRSLEQNPTFSQIGESGALFGPGSPFTTAIPRAAR
jgi:hypothetical protein